MRSDYLQMLVIRMMMENMQLLRYSEKCCDISIVMSILLLSILLSLLVLDIRDIRYMDTL